MEKKIKKYTIIPPTTLTATGRPKGGQGGAVALQKIPKAKIYMYTCIKISFRPYKKF